MAKTKTSREPDPMLEQFGSVTDSTALTKALTMLRKERFQLFAEADANHVLGVIRSPSDPKRVYACKLNADGTYYCCTQNLIKCVTSSRSPCKHVLVLVLGLTKAGQCASSTSIDWLSKSQIQGKTTTGSQPDKEEVTSILVRYQGVEAGEIDWRPTETLPEDFYAM